MHSCCHMEQTPCEDAVTTIYMHLNWACNRPLSIYVHTISASAIWYICRSQQTACAYCRHCELRRAPSDSVWTSWGEPKRAPHLRVRRLPAYASGVDIYIYIYIYIYVCILYLGQQFGQRFRRLARSFVSLKDGNTFKDVWDVQRKTWIPFSRRAMRLFVHVDVSFDWARDHFDRWTH